MIRRKDYNKKRSFVSLKITTLFADNYDVIINSDIWRLDFSATPFVQKPKKQKTPNQKQKETKIDIVSEPANEPGHLKPEIQKPKGKLPSVPKVNDHIKPHREMNYQPNSNQYKPQFHPRGEFSSAGFNRNRPQFRPRHDNLRNEGTQNNYRRVNFNENVHDNVRSGRGASNSSNSQQNNIPFPRNMHQNDDYFQHPNQNFQRGLRNNHNTQLINLLQQFLSQLQSQQMY